MRRFSPFFLIVVLLSCKNSVSAADWIDVAHVELSDTLSIRSEAKANSAKIGELAFDSKFIEITGNGVKIGSSTWIPIKVNQLTGWVNQRYTKPSVLDRSHNHLACIGTEPFWSFDVAHGTIVYKEFSEHISDYAIVKSLPSVNHTNVHVLGFENYGHQGTAFLKKSGSCSDDMSDKEYSYDIVVRFPEGKVISGCCDVLN